jgi:hypothetical protein
MRGLYDAAILTSALFTILNVILYWRSELAQDPGVLYLILLAAFAVTASILLVGRGRWRGSRLQDGVEVLHHLPTEIDVRYPSPFQMPPHLSLSLKWKRRWADSCYSDDDFSAPSRDALPECRTVDQRRDGFRVFIDGKGVVFGEGDRLHVTWRATGIPARGSGSR